jgi:hypothetical protein
MVVIEHIIGELLLRHNCVIVPSFGGFVAKRASATIDYTTGVMQPPKKSILFNRQLINNDGLLIAECAVKNRLNYTTAEQSVQEMVDGWKSALNRGERVSIDKVGFLYFDAEKNLCFEQDRFFNLLLESYGLGKVHFLTAEDVELAQRAVIATELTTETSETKVVPIVFDQESTRKIQDKEPEIIDHPAAQKSSSTWKYIAAACVLPFAFYSYWIPAKTNVLESGMISFHDFNPLHQPTQAAYQKTSAIQAVEFPQDEAFEDQLTYTDGRTVYQYDETFSVEVILPKVAEESSTKTLKETPTLSVGSNQSLEWIVGCFSNASNAERLVNQLKSKGFQAYILDVNEGLTRVSAGGASSQADIQALASKVSAAGFDGWTLKK